MRARQKRILSVAAPFAVAIAVLVYGVWLLVGDTTSEGEGLASGIANDAAREFGVFVIVLDLLLLMPVALWVSASLIGRVDRAEMNELNPRT